MINPNFKWNEQAFEAMANALRAGYSVEAALAIYRQLDALQGIGIIDDGVAVPVTGAAAA